MEMRRMMSQMLVTLLACVAIGLSAPAGKGSIVERDTDQISALRSKLSRLSDLLSSLEGDDEKDLQSLNKPDLRDEKSPMSPNAEGMDYRGQNQHLQPQEQRPQSQASVDDKSGSTEPEDDSIHTLAAALAQLRSPKFDSKDSTGDYLSANPDFLDSNNNQQNANLEKLIEQALTNLSRGQAADGSYGPSYENKKGLPPPNKSSLDLSGLYDVYYGGSLDGGRARQVQTARTEDSRLREKAIRIVEARLMQDILTADKLGISVDDLILDLDNKAYREAQISKMEEGLDGFRK